MAMPTMEHSRSSPSVGNQGKEFVRNFFPPVLSRHIGIRLPFIRNEFLPAVAMKKIVEGCAAILPPLPSVSAFFVFATTEMPPLGCLKKGARNAVCLCISLPRPPDPLWSQTPAAESQRLSLPELPCDARFSVTALQRFACVGHAARLPEPRCC